MSQYLLLYLFWGELNSVISPWTLPIIFHATGAWPNEGATHETRGLRLVINKCYYKPQQSRLQEQLQKKNQALLLPQKTTFFLLCFHLLLDPTSASEMIIKPKAAGTCWREKQALNQLPPPKGMPVWKNEVRKEELKTAWSGFTAQHMHKGLV